MLHDTHVHEYSWVFHIIQTFGARIFFFFCQEVLIFQNFTQRLSRREVEEGDEDSDSQGQQII